VSAFVNNLRSHSELKSTWSSDRALMTQAADSIENLRLLLAHARQEARRAKRAAWTHEQALDWVLAGRPRQGEAINDVSAPVFKIAAWLPIPQEVLYDLVGDPRGPMHGPWPHETRMPYERRVGDKTVEVPWPGRPAGKFRRATPVA
jgi:hypothetical protein